MPTLRKIKRAAMPPHKPTKIAAHLILPERTKNPPITRLTIGNGIDKQRKNKILTLEAKERGNEHSAN